MIRPCFSASLLVIAACATLQGAARAQDSRPNILIFMADDQYMASVGCYGAEPSHTPNIDRLAAEGVRFTQCFTPSAICTPNRAAFLSGMLPLKNGAHPNHSGFFDGVKSLPNYMKELGYRAALINKDGIRRPSDIYAWETWIRESNTPLPGATQPRSRRHRATRFDAVEKIMTADDGRPFCIVHAARQPHTPYLGRIPNGLEGYDASNWQLDADLGRYLQLLEQHGLVENTIVIYTNDNEANIPRSKYTLYDTGIRVPFIVRWPGHTTAGESSDAMVSFLDVLPTLVEIAGGESDPVWDGRSMRGVWEGTAETHHEELYFSFTGISLGSDRKTTPFPIRALRTDRYKYVRNLNYTLGHPSQDGVAVPYEELYDLEADPAERSNLADASELGDLKRSLSAKVDAWMKATDDEGIESELEALRRYPVEEQ